MNEPREAMFYEKLDGGAAACGLCHHKCKIPEGGAGFCGVRKNTGGTLYALGYGICSAVNLDPIEKKPLRRFHPGGRILSIGGFGCNLICPFCQNSEISVLNGATWLEGNYIPPEALAAHAEREKINGNIGVAFTYNEPTINAEYILDCFRIFREAGLFNVLVTNGSVTGEALAELLPLTDAMNIDLKGFSAGFYKKIGGDLETVKETIKLSNERCHVEVTTLIIPGENDSPEEIEALSRWLSSVSPGIPLHLTRFFPRYKYTGKSPTPKETILRHKKNAENFCRYCRI